MLLALLIGASVLTWRHMRKPLEERIRFGREYEARGLGMISTAIYRRRAVRRILARDS